MSRKWRFRWRDEDPTPPPEMPPAQTEVSLPDPEEARQALAQSQEGKQTADLLGREVREALSGMREARERNHFAEAILAIIREGR